MSVITEIHGWVSLRYSYENSDAALDLHEREMPRIVRWLETRIAELPFHSADVRVVASYGEFFVTICGFRWNNGDLLLAEELLREIGREAKGSYGCLYHFNHDMQTVRVLVLRKGIVTEQADTLFTPFIPLVDDPPQD